MSTCSSFPWRRKWQSYSSILAWKIPWIEGSLEAYCPWGHEECSLLGCGGTSRPCLVACRELSGWCGWESVLNRSLVWDPKRHLNLASRAWGHEVPSLLGLWMSLQVSISLCNSSHAQLVYLHGKIFLWWTENSGGITHIPEIHIMVLAQHISSRGSSYLSKISLMMLFVHDLEGSCLIAYCNFAFVSI